MPLSGVLKQLLNYWQSLPLESGQRMPGLTTLNIDTLHEFLPKLTLMKRLDRYDVLVSVMGTGTPTPEYGQMIGINAFDLTSPGMREQAAQFYESVLDQPSAALMHKVALRKDGKKANVSSLYLPLADKAGAANFIIGCSVYDNKPEQSKTHSRPVMDQSHVRSVEFIDIGYGAPTWQFKRPANMPNLPPAGSWWEKFMPTRARPMQPHRLDS